MKQLGCGVYVIWLWLPEEFTTKVGALGECFFPVGYYAYAGSAQKGLWQRLHRHAKTDKPLHWHIDYLRCRTTLESAAVANESKQGECGLAQGLAQVPGASVVVPSFGSSDCKCKTHLFHYPTRPHVIDHPTLLAADLRIVAISDLLAN